ncbi:hypothetical protein ACFFQG_32200, partial [Shinella granuli]|uniref:hypothetical protein n=1 Tax=Shinella granuli TaxID=323621 RepID=UPI0035EB4E7B
PAVSGRRRSGRLLLRPVAGFYSAVDNNDAYPQAGSGAAVAFTFGLSNITITNNTGVTWAAGSNLLASFGDNTDDGSYNADVRVDAIVSLTAATGTTGNTVADVGTEFTQATLNNNFKALADKQNEVIAALKAAGILVK